MSIPPSPQPLGALSSSSSIYVFGVPPRDQLEGPPGNINLENGTADLVAEFTLLGTQVRVDGQKDRLTYRQISTMETIGTATNDYPLFRG